MKNNLKEDTVPVEKENLQIDIIDLELTQLHYSVKAIEYIKVKKKSDIELTYSQLHKCDTQAYILSVYYYDTIDGIKTYHVYGQEAGSENAFILGALLLGTLLDDISIRDKIYIKGILHSDKSDQEKNKIELSNLNGMFGGEFIFKIQPKTGEIVPLFTLDGMIAKPEIGTVSKPLDKSTPENYIESLKKRYERYGYHDAKCPKGSPFCVHFCNDYDKIANQCVFKCPFNREECDTACQYYVNSRLLNCLYTKIKDRPYY